MAKNREHEKPAGSDSESDEEEDSSSEESSESGSESESESESGEEEDSSSEESGEPGQIQVTKIPSSSKPPAAAAAAAKKPQLHPAPIPQQASSSSSSDEDKIPSSSKPPAAAKKPQLHSASKPQKASSSSSSEEEVSESESEPKSDGPDPELRPVAINPEDDPQKSTKGARKSRSKPTAAEPVTPTKSAGVKRPAEEKETETQDAKKSKKNKEPEISEKKSTNDPKKALFQRIWSEEDEIVVLKGMIDYWAKKKIDPVADLSAFHESIKKNLHVDVTKTQLQDKIRRLKKKYQNNDSREKKDGKERTFPKPHEQEAYELSKSVWGKENMRENGISSRKAAIKRANAGTDNAEPKDAKAVDAAGVNAEPKDAKAAVDAAAAVNAEPKDAKAVDAGGVKRAKRVKLIGATVEERVLMIGTEMFEENKKEGDEGAEEWNKLRMEEMEVYLRNLEVKSAQARVVIQRLKSEEK